VQVPPTDHEPAGHLVGVKVAQVVGLEVGLRVAGDHTGVFGGDVEVHLVASVGRCRLCKVSRELGELLVGEHHREVVAALLGQDVVDGGRQRQEVLVMPSA